MPHWDWLSVFVPSSRDKFTVKELQRLHRILLRQVTCPGAGSAEEYVEALRSMAELVIWGDQHDAILVEYFLSENMLSHFPLILENPENLTGGVARQVLQTLGLLIQNIKETETLYCLFSNNHLNRILSMEFDFDEEILGYYVNVLKTISLKLDEHSAEFFLVRDDTFTLYSKALKFGMSQDSMVRAAVRNITLSSYCIPSESVRKCFEREETCLYFNLLSENLVEACCSLDALLIAESSDPLEIEQLLCHIDDELVYFNEVFSTGAPAIVCMVIKSFWRDIILNLCVGSLRSDTNQTASGKGAMPKKAKKGQRCIRPATALLVLETYISSVSNPQLLSLLVSIVLGGDSLTLGNEIMQDHTFLDVSDILITDNPSEVHGIRKVLMGHLERGDSILAPRILRLMASILRHGDMTDDLLCTIGLIPFDRIVRQKEIPPLKRENTRVQSFPVDIEGIFESASSACFSDRHGEVLEAIFSSIKSPYTSPLTIMTATWILSKMIGDDGESVLERLRPYREGVKSFLDSYHACVLSKMIGVTDWVDIVPLMVTYYWPKIQEIKSRLFSVRSSISSWKSTLFLQEMESQGFDNAHAKGLNACLVCILGFLSRYQLHQLVVTGTIRKACPFPGPIRVMKGDVGQGDLVSAPHGAFPINTNHALLKIWKSSNAECMWYEQIISIVVLEKDSNEQYRVASIAPIVAASPTRPKGSKLLLSVSVRPEISTVLRQIKKNPLGVDFYTIGDIHLFTGDEIKISFTSSDDCEFVHKLVHQINEDLRDRCTSHIASLIPS